MGLYLCLDTIHRGVGRLSTLAITSKFPVHIAGIEEQAVAILATIAILLNGRINEFTGTDAAAATMFVIMALSTLLLGLCFHLAARFNLGLLIQLMPFPVVCGFLAGTGWLFFSTAIQMLTDVEISIFKLPHILTYDLLIRWLPALACGLAIFAIMRVKEHFLTLPATLLACCLGFYAIAYWQGASLEGLREEAGCFGWVWACRALVMWRHRSCSSGWAPPAVLLLSRARHFACWRRSSAGRSSSLCRNS